MVQVRTKDLIRQSPLTAEAQRTLRLRREKRRRGKREWGGCLTSSLRNLSVLCASAVSGDF
jgi:hypothetical protein